MRLRSEADLRTAHDHLELRVEERTAGLQTAAKTLTQERDFSTACGTSEQMLATVVILFLVFVPIFAFGALSDVMGEKALVRTFFKERLEFAVVNRQPQE